AALYTGVGLSVLFAAATVVFHDRITAFQVTRGAGGEAEVSASIWIRAGQVVLPALLYQWTARRHRRGSRRRGPSRGSCAVRARRRRRAAARATGDGRRS
ncbi:MAG TPA: hypothetical protein VGF17_24755, partial [Phytomonospora sp.]